MIKACGVEVDRVRLLMELVNGALPIGHGFKNPNARAKMTVKDAEEALAERKATLGEHDYFAFDYLWGRPLKMREHHGELDDRCGDLYDRDAGPGAFARAVTRARVPA